MLTGIVPRDSVVHPAVVHSDDNAGLTMLDATMEHVTDGINADDGDVVVS